MIDLKGLGQRLHIYEYLYKLCFGDRWGRDYFLVILMIHLSAISYFSLKFGTSLLEKCSSHVFID